jgi:hypothetical protein
MLKNQLRKYLSPQLLVLDEVGYPRHSGDHSGDNFPGIIRIRLSNHAFR